MKSAGLDQLPPVMRGVVVCSKISPGNPSTKPTGTTVCTLWDELA